MDKYIGTKIIHAYPEVEPGQNTVAPREGYHVVYDQGGPDEYHSWSPKDVFEAAYHPDNEMTFGDAIHMLKLGERVTRAGWNGKNMWLELQRPDSMSKMGLPYIFMCTVDVELVPWLASQTDMLAEDWILLFG